MRYQAGCKYSVRLTRAGSNGQSIMVEGWRVVVIEVAVKVCVEA